jgi:Asp-tRNA(Asn)/Glu-tRNA(Gln) amidotransferase A subunit family amidase
MPVGVSLVGRLGRDGELLETAASVEAVLPALGLPPAWA